MVPLYNNGSDAMTNGCPSSLIFMLWKWSIGFLCSFGTKHELLRFKASHRIDACPVMAMSGTDRV